MKHQTMFTIDLLKGQGIPAHSTPTGIIITIMSVIVPLVIAIALLSNYLNDKIVISVHTQRIKNYDSQMNKLTSAIEKEKSFKKQHNSLNNCMSEITSFYSKEIQWSPILAMLAKNIPNSVVLTELDVKENTVRKEVPNKNNPDEMVNVLVLTRTLKIFICGRTNSDCAQDVREFRDSLLFSDVLGQKLKDIQVSQKAATLEGRDVVLYEIDCIFKSIL